LETTPLEGHNLTIKQEKQSTLPYKLAHNWQMRSRHEAWSPKIASKAFYSKNIDSTNDITIAILLIALTSLQREKSLV